jgi:hypothetical protein
VGKCNAKALHFVDFFYSHNQLKINVVGVTVKGRIYDDFLVNAGPNKWASEMRCREAGKTLLCTSSLKKNCGPT